MLKVIIFAILFLTEETQDTTPFLLMVYSDAQPVQFWPIECNTYNQNTPNGVFYNCYEHKWQCDDEIVIQVTDDSIIERNLDLIARNSSGTDLVSADATVEVLTDKTVYTWRITATDYSLCNEKVAFFVRDFDTSEDIAHSDVHYFLSNVEDSILITYYNHINVFGLIYDDTSPDVQFNLRIPAIFYHQRFPEEDEVIELTSELVTINGSMRRQRLLDTDYLPYYMHEKIKLALKHQFVSIYNKFWTKQESYDIQDGNRMHPEKKAKCWISETEYMQRSVL
jgi:hypothetical protein